MISLNLAALFAAAPAFAQTQQYVYFNGVYSISGFAKNGKTAALTPTPGSPYAVRFNPAKLILDATGKFLIALNADAGAGTISMYQIDGNTGAISEVPNSPFAAPGQNMPQAFAVSREGNYLFVGNTVVSGFNATGLINTYSVDGPSQSLIPSPNPPTSSFPGPIAFVTDPKGRNLYTLGYNNLALDVTEHLGQFRIDPATGSLFFLGDGGQGEVARSLAMDPKGRFLYAGHGHLSGFIDAYLISPADGSLMLGSQPGVQLGQGIMPDGLFVESSGNYLYASLPGNVARIFAIDQNSGALTDVTGPNAPTLAFDATAADPMGPYLYTIGGGIHVYQVDPATGALTDVPGSPFPLPQGGGSSMVITTTAVQPVVGPVAVLTPPTLEFGDVVLPQPGPTPVVHLTNTGDQSLTINGIAISGPNSGDFSQTNNCGPVLPPNAFCSISVTLIPVVAGDRKATLAVTDNAPGSPHPVALHGTGVTPNPAASLSFGKLDFGNAPVSMTAGPNTTTLTNTGQTPLHISSITLGGANPGDYSLTNTCPATLLTTLSCTINATFLPKALGDRPASVVITDDAADSPQTIALRGVGTAPFTVGASGSGATSATVTQGQTAQYSLQISPVAQFQGTVALACTGAPLLASCRVSPATLQINASGNTSAIPVGVTVTTTAPSGGLALPMKPRGSSPRGIGLALSIAVLFFVLFTLRRPAQRMAWCRVVAGFALFVVLGAAGCGGGSNSPAPAAFPGTPAGTSTLTVTAADGNVTQQIQLTLIVK